MHIEQLDNGKYKFIEYYIDPYSEKRRRVSVTLDKNTPQMRNKAVKYLQDKIKKKVSEKPNQDLTFREVYEQFYTQWQLSVKEQTRHTFKVIDETVFSRVPKGILMRNVSSHIVQQIINELYNEGYAESTLRLYLLRFKQVADYAVNHDYIAANQFKKVKLPKKEKTPEEAEKKKNNYFSQSDVQQLVNYFDNKNQRHYSIICQVLFLTGLRYGELMGLKETDINEQRLTISINGTYNLAQKKKTSTKTDGSTRTILVTETVIHLINEYKRLNVKRVTFERLRNNTDQYIFLSQHGRPIVLGSFNRILKRAIQTLGLPQYATSHIFRHSHISLLAELGMPVKQIMERVGHLDPETTLKIYSHVTEKMEQNLQNKLEKISF